MGSRRPPAVVCVVGASGAGKTTLIEDLLPRLRALGVSVGAVKHASHGFEADRPGKDSHRLYAAGAGAVALISAEQLAVFSRPAPGGPCLADALAALPPGLDLVLAEGFSWEPRPRIVVAAANDARLRDHLLGGEVVAVLASPATEPGLRPRFEPSWLAWLAETLAARAREEARRAPARRAGAPHLRLAPRPSESSRA